MLYQGCYYRHNVLSNHIVGLLIGRTSAIIGCHFHANIHCQLHLVPMLLFLMPGKSSLLTAVRFPCTTSIYSYYSRHLSIRCLSVWQVEKVIAAATDL